MHERQIKHYLPYAISVAQLTLQEKRKADASFCYTKKWRNQFTNFSGSCAGASFKSIVAEYCEESKADIPLKQIMIMIDRTVRSKGKGAGSIQEARDIKVIERELIENATNKQIDYVTAAAALKYAMDIFRQEVENSGESTPAAV